MSASFYVPLLLVSCGLMEAELRPHHVGAGYGFLRDIQIASSIYELMHLNASVSGSVLGFFFSPVLHDHMVSRTQISKVRSEWARCCVGHA